MAKRIRRMLETTLYNLRYDMDCIGEGEILFEEIRELSDDELIRLLNEWQEEV